MATSHRVLATDGMIVPRQMPAVPQVTVDHKTLPSGSPTHSSQTRPSGSAPSAHYGARSRNIHSTARTLDGGIRRIRAQRLPDGGRGHSPDKKPHENQSRHSARRPGRHRRATSGPEATETGFPSQHHSARPRNPGETV